MNTKSILAACLSLALGVALGYVAFDLLKIGSTGRNFMQIAIPAAGVLFFSGLIYGRLWMRTWSSCFAGVALYGMTVCLGVIYFSGGLTFASFILGWAAIVMGLTLPPWLLGAAIGRWAQRFALTE